MLNTRVLVCEGAKTKRGGNLCATISVWVGVSQGKYVQCAAPGAGARVTGNLFTSRGAADEHPGIHMCEKNPARHQEPLTKGRNGDAQEVPSTKKGCMTPLCLYAI